MRGTENLGQIIYDTTPSVKPGWSMNIVADHVIYTIVGDEGAVSLTCPLGLEFVELAMITSAYTLLRQGRRGGR
jgi:hypothetical protein